MTSDIFLSEEYIWSCTRGLFELVLEFVRDAVEEPVTRSRIEEVLARELPVLDLQTLPDAGREQVMHCLRTRLTQWAESELAPTLGHLRAEARFFVGHVKVLALMARDIEDSSTTGWGERQEESPADRQG